MQYCRDLLAGAGVQCGCADGFKLDTDERSCSKTGNEPETGDRRMADLRRCTSEGHLPFLFLSRVVSLRPAAVGVAVPNSLSVESARTAQHQQGQLADTEPHRVRGGSNNSKCNAV